METRASTPLKYPATVAALALLVFSTAAAAPQNENKSQSVYLPDPTPRERDPNLIYGDHPEDRSHTGQLQSRQNAKRRELIEWGANELVVLSQRLQGDLARLRPGDSLAAQAANAGRIEQLAKNLKAAAKAP